MTTHSPIVIQELEASCLKIVRSAEGETSLIAVPSSLQGVIRAASDALLGRKVIVCEGKTEVGICRAFDQFWSEVQRNEGFAYLGVVAVEGGGSDAPQRALDLRTLGYVVSFIGDSDRELVPGPEVMEAAGIRVLCWADGKSIEERIAYDLPWEGVLEVVALAVAERSEQSVIDSIRNRLIENTASVEGDFHEWQDSELLRQAIGLTAKSANWVKRIELGQRVGEIICRHIERIAGTDLGQKISELRRWVEGDD